MVLYIPKLEFPRSRAEISDQSDWIVLDRGNQRISDRTREDKRKVIRSDRIVSNHTRTDNIRSYHRR